MAHDTFILIFENDLNQGAVVVRVCVGVVRAQVVLPSTCVSPWLCVSCPPGYLLRELPVLRHRAMAVW